MRWPWQRNARNDRFVIACSTDEFVYALMEHGQLRRCGVERRDADTPQAFAKRVRALGLPATNATAVLPLFDCQLLQIDMPAVPAPELKAAARWHIKGKIDAHLDDLTLDVMTVGDGRQSGPRQLFVAAARNQAIRETTELARAAGIEIAVIDIRETAQRNVQTALAQSRSRLDRANALLMVHGTQCLLTICARGELFFARRFKWTPELLIDEPAAPLHHAPAGMPVAFDLDNADFVDYGAEPAVGHADDVEESALVIELQRSIDMWERAHADLQLDTLFVHATGDSAALAARLTATLEPPVEVLAGEAIFPGLSACVASPEAQSQLLPVIGALLRTETRQL